MASQSTQIPGKGYGNTYIDSLVWGCGWVNVSPADPIHYWFGTSSVSAVRSSIDDGFTGLAWSDNDKSKFTQALASYDKVCNLSFAQATSQETADMVWWLADNTTMSGYLGLHEVPDQSTAQVYGYFNTQDSTWNALAQGGYGFVTIIHELGHGLGLAHPHDGGGERDATKFPGVKAAFNSYGTNNLNQGIYTTMSYNSGWQGERPSSYDFGWEGTPMALDIAALQKLYGANMTTATGNDTYLLPSQNGVGTYWQCIWDAGGQDTLSNAGSSSACTINLTAATLTGASAGGMVSWNKTIKGGFTIANGVVIENAIGGSGADVLVGNAQANQLTGGAGTDVLTGGAGSDKFIFSTGDSLAGSRLRDTIKDFNGRQGDRLDLSGIDAKTTAQDDQAFTYIAAAKFHRVAGELRFNSSVLQGDTNGDGVADFELALTGVRTLDATWLIL
jgi:serralysin